MEGYVVNSQECLKNAQDCTEQANRATSATVRAELLRVAMAWIELAEEIDRLEAFRQEQAKSDIN
jgi:hypothetical protein